MTLASISAALVGGLLPPQEGHPLQEDHRGGSARVLGELKHVVRRTGVVLLYPRVVTPGVVLLYPRVVG